MEKRDMQCAITEYQDSMTPEKQGQIQAAWQLLEEGKLDNLELKEGELEQPQTRWKRMSRSQSILTTLRAA
ncbi:MAG: hypothetical protein LBG52_03290 [Candidatus Peribacteria bacterium]|nr:hypothetical protein [Candidatus Peribacteria bacterium]